MRVQYTRLSGEAYQLGAGYAVAKMGAGVKDLGAFLKQFDDLDIQRGNAPLAAAVAALLLVLGIFLLYTEHSKPLKLLKIEADRLVQGESQQLQVSRFSGQYRKIAIELNEGMERLFSHGGDPRNAVVDLDEVLGESSSDEPLAAFNVATQTLTHEEMSQSSNDESQ